MSENQNVAFMPVAYRGGSGTVYSVNIGSQPTKAPLISTPAEETVGSEYQKWGATNLYPKEIREKIQKSTTANPLAVKSVCMMYGSGLVYFKELKEKDGVSRDFSEIKEVEEFLYNNDIESFLIERLMDHRFYNNMFCEYLLNAAATEILSLNHLEAEFCRFGSVKEGKIINVKYSSDWSKTSITPQDIPYISDLEKRNRDSILNKAKSAKKFATHSGLPSPGTTMYNIPVHAGLVRENGWLDYSNSIPELMNQINKSGLKVRYHVEIPVEYWTTVEPKFQSMTKEEQKKIMDLEIDRMEDFLIKNGSAIFYSNYSKDKITGKEIPGWKITAIKDPVERDKFLTSVQEADVQSARSFMVDLSLAGIQSEGGKMGAGSGSDKRVGFDNSISMTHAEQLYVLEPLYVVKRFNNWPINLKFAFQHEITTTLNENKNGVKQEIN